VVSRLFALRRTHHQHRELLRADIRRVGPGARQDRLQVRFRGATARLKLAKSATGGSLKISLSIKKSNLQQPGPVDPAASQTVMIRFGAHEATTQS